MDDEKVLAGRYDNFLKSHSVPDDMYIDSQTVPQPVDMATQNVSELFTQLQQANAKVSELEKQVRYNFVCLIVFDTCQIHQTVVGL